MMELHPIQDAVIGGTVVLAVVIGSELTLVLLQKIARRIQPSERGELNGVPETPAVSVIGTLLWMASALGLCGVSFAILAFFVDLVLPQMKDIYDQLGAELPSPTEFIMVLREPIGRRLAYLCLAAWWVPILWPVFGFRPVRENTNEEGSRRGRVPRWVALWLLPWIIGIAARRMAAQAALRSIIVWLFPMMIAMLFCVIALILPMINIGNFGWFFRE